MKRHCPIVRTSLFRKAHTSASSGQAYTLEENQNHILIDTSDTENGIQNLGMRCKTNETNVGWHIDTYASKLMSNRVSIYLYKSEMS